MGGMTTVTVTDLDGNVTAKRDLTADQLAQLLGKKTAGVDELNMRAALAAVNKWEKHCIATTDIDGPLSIFAKDLLIKTIFELLNESAPVVQAEVDTFGPSPKRRGRPPKCQSPQSMQPQQPSSGKPGLS